MALHVERHPGVPGRSSRAATIVPGATDGLFFFAQQQPDGTYSISLTEDGVQTFETALGVARDLGAKTRISPHSTIADIMERTATREELSHLLKEGGDRLLLHIRTLVLRRMLRGSEKPSARQRTVSRIGKMTIVAIVALWALKQFAIAIQDIEDIPGILANLPGDILNLHPTAAFEQVGSKISDAGQHVLFGALVACLTYIVAKAARPFDRIYRKDQLVPGERIMLRCAHWALRKADEGSRRANAEEEQTTR